MKTDIIKLYIRPGAAETRVEGIYQDRIKIRINAPPEKGRANRELLKFIAKTLFIPKSQITILSGKTSNYKEILIKPSPNKDYYDILLGQAPNYSRR
ncbi:DUF167 domain-containing protein [Actinomycetota bacterium]